MRAMAARLPFLRQVRAAGLVAAVDLVGRDGQVLDPRRRTGRLVHKQAIARGALLRPLGDTMYVFPPLDTSVEDLRAMVSVLSESIEAVL
jgi:adenosylmethionine-8-amino-7-oxononanoate aminotransferase